MAAYTVNDRELKRSLDLNILAITFGMVYFTVFGAPVGSSLFTGFMRKLGAGDLVYSIVMALPVLGAVSQVLGSYFLETTGKRRFLFLSCGFAHRLLWIPVALIPLFIGPECHEARILSITILITFSSIGNSLVSVAFNSWMGNLVPPDIAGRFFSKRTLVSTISGSVAGLVVGGFVDQVNTLNGFALVFVIGALFGVCDILTFVFVKHPPMELPSEKPSLTSIFVEPFKNRNYLKLSLFATVYAFGVNISGPFFNVYMIENLKMSYFIIALSCTITSGLTTVMCVRKWGALADRYGNKPVVYISAIGIAVNPFLWFFTSPSVTVMVYIVNLVGGAFWSGYNLAIYNQSVWLAPNKSRSAYLACYTLLTSVIGTALANVCGGLFMQYMRPFIDSLRISFPLGGNLTAYHLLFAFSGILRILAIMIFLPMVKETNAVSARKMLSEESRIFAQMNQLRPRLRNRH